MESSEQDLTKLMGKILRILVGLTIWSLITIFLGLYVRWALIYETGFDIYNAMFYGWVLVSFPVLIYYFYRVYKR